MVFVVGMEIVRLEFGVMQATSTCPGRDAAFFMPLRRTGTPVSLNHE
jgi:hypothetical protein